MQLAGMTLDGFKTYAGVVSEGHIYRIVRFTDAASLGLFGEVYKSKPYLRNIFAKQFVAVECELDGSIITALPYMSETVEGCVYKARLSASSRYRELQKRLCRLIGTDDAAEAVTIVLEMKAIEKEAEDS